MFLKVMQRIYHLFKRLGVALKEEVEPKYSLQFVSIQINQKWVEKEQAAVVIEVYLHNGHAAS